MGNRFDHVFQIKVVLQGIRPPVWRRIQVPCTYSFWDLHVAIQDAMGWLDSHLHAFLISGGLDRLRVRIGIPFDDDWDDGPPVFPGWTIPVARHLTLADRKIVYEYDFGDDWQHAVTLEKVLPRQGATEYPICVGGRRACPPEDCGGVPGYARLLEVLADPADEEHEELLTWVGGSYDAARFEPGEVVFMDPGEKFRMAFAG